MLWNPSLPYIHSVCVGFIARHSPPDLSSCVSPKLQGKIWDGKPGYKFSYDYVFASFVLHVRYLMQSAEVRIMGFLAGQAEEIAVTYQLPDFTYEVCERVLTCEALISFHKQC